MRKRSIILLLIVGILLIFTGCNSENENKSEMDLTKLTEYKDSVVGDNSAIGNIIHNLPGAKYAESFALKTDKEPYGIMVDYVDKKDPQEKEDKENYWTKEVTEKIFLNNATAMFALVKNLQNLTFNLQNGDEQKVFTVTRKDMEKFYGKDLKGYGNDKELWQKEVIDNTLNSQEKIDSFFKEYPIKNK